MDHIVGAPSACVAGNLFVQNAKASLASKMQNYDYLLSIAAVKRFQGSYQSTLVAQGAFSAYRTEVVREVGGWKNVLGEDIVLTYALLEQGLASSYEPAAVGYTNVPASCNALYNQRKRWGMGMLEGLETGNCVFALFYLGKSLGDLSGYGVSFWTHTRSSLSIVRVLLLGGLPHAVYCCCGSGFICQYVSLSKKIEYSISK